LEGWIIHFNPGGFMSANAAESADYAQRRRRWPWVLLALAALIWFAPLLVAKTPLLDWILAKAVGPLNGSLRVGNASLGWLSPIMLEDVELRDVHGASVVRVERIDTTKRLWRFLWGRDNLGILRVDKADVNLAITPNGSNLETILQPLLEGLNQSEAKSAPTTLVLEVKESTLTLSENGRPHGTLRPIDITLALNANQQTPIELRAGIAHLEKGNLKIQLTRREQFAESARPPWLLNVEGSDFPLAPLNALLARFASSARVGGDWSGKIDASWDDAANGGAVKLTSDMRMRKAWFEIPGCEERLTLDEIDCPASIRLEEGRLTAAPFEFRCDLGSGKITGALDIKDLAGSLRRHGLELRLDVNLAKLVEKLPRTLRIHEDLQLHSGNVSVRVSSAVKDKEVQWSGDFVAGDLAGTRAGRAVAWPEPVRGKVKLRQPFEGFPHVDFLDCRSGFLSVQGQGNAEQFRLQGEADLNKLTASLGQFVDLSAVKLHGQARLNAELQTLKSGHRQAKADLQVQGWVVEWAGAAVWREERAIVKAEALAILDGAKQTLLSAQATWESGADRAQASLWEPFDVAAGQWGAWDVTLRGDLTRWQRRGELLSGAWGEWKIAGGADIKGLVRRRDGNVLLTGVTMAAKDFQVRGPGVWLNEPTLELDGEALVSSGKLLCEKLQVRCPAVNANGANITFDWTADFEVSGGLSLSADVARWRRWFLDPAGPAPQALSGAAVGQVGVRWKSRSVSFDANFGVRDFAFGPPTQPSFRDPHLKLQAKGSWDGAKDWCLLDGLKVESQFLSCAAKGKMDQLSGAGMIDVKGTLRYDLKKMEPLLKPYLGKNAEIEGKEERPFHLTGALLNPALVLGGKADAPALALAGEAGLHWDRLKAFRCDIGRADARFRLENGWLSLVPLDASLNGGNLHLDAKLRLSPGPAELQMPKGSLIQRAQITPAMCADALGYALPALAGVTQAEGLMSLDLEHVRMPVDDPHRTDMKGLLTLHDVRVGPSPLLRELSQLFNGPAPVKLKKEARVPIQVVNQKVYHQDMELIFPDLTIRTSGWVGFDGSLGLVAEMPISPSWVGGDRVGKALEGKRIRVPITGTLESPKLDRREFQAAIARFVRDAGGAIIRNELEDRLKKLILPRK